MEAKNGAVFVHLFHDLIMSRFAEITFFPLKHDFEEVTLAIVPDSYVLFLGHNTMPFLMEEARGGRQPAETSARPWRHATRPASAAAGPDDVLAPAAARERWRDAGGQRPHPPPHPPPPAPSAPP